MKPSEVTDNILGLEDSSDEIRVPEKDANVCLGVGLTKKFIVDLYNLKLIPIGRSLRTDEKCGVRSGYAQGSSNNNGLAGTYEIHATTQVDDH